MVMRVPIERSRVRMTSKRNCTILNYYFQVWTLWPIFDCFPFRIHDAIENTRTYVTAPPNQPHWVEDGERRVLIDFQILHMHFALSHIHDSLCERTLSLHLFLWRSCHVCAMRIPATLCAQIHRLWSIGCADSKFTIHKWFDAAAATLPDVTSLNNIWNYCNLKFIIIRAIRAVYTTHAVGRSPFACVQLQPH